MYYSNSLYIIYVCCIYFVVTNQSISYFIIILSTLCLELLKATGRTFKDPVQIEDWKLTLGTYIGELGKFMATRSVHAINFAWYFACAFCDFFKEAQSKGPHRQSCLALMRFKICLVSGGFGITDSWWFMVHVMNFYDFSATDEAVEVAVQQGQVILEDEPSMVAAFSLDMAKLILGWKVATEVLRSTMDF